MPVVRPPALARPRWALVLAVVAVTFLVPLGATAAVLPLRHYRLTGRFGERGGRWSSRHTGLDFAAPYGTRIRSIAAGVVTRTGSAGPFGRRTVVRLPNGTRVWFCHQSRVRVSVGDRVRAGQVIGAIGTSGNVTGPHLHLEVHPRGRRAVDPRSWLRRHRHR